MYKIVVVVVVLVVVAGVYHLKMRVTFPPQCNIQCP